MHNVIDIDEEKEKYEQCVADINTLIEAGNDVLLGKEKAVVDHYIDEIRRLEKVEQNALHLINSFVEERKTEISKNQKESMKYIQTAKAVLEDAKKKVTAPSKNYGRINGYQAEKVLYSLAVKLQQIQRSGIPKTIHRYGKAEIREWEKAKVRKGRTPRQVTLSDVSSMDSDPPIPGFFTAPLLGETGLKALDMGEYNS